MKTIQQAIGIRVKHLRMEHHFNGGDFAKKVGWKPDYLSRFEQGKWRLLEPGKLIALADELQVSLDHLMGR